MPNIRHYDKTREKNIKPPDFTRLSQDETQLLNYLKATNKRIGLLLNFGQKSLEIKRRIL